MGEETMNDNYAVINGKKIELTEKQIKTLGFEIQKPLFERVTDGGLYYFINYYSDIEEDNCEDDALFDCVNYFTDKDFAKQVALHQLLYRKLLKFAYENDCEDREWGTKHEHWRIYYDTDSDKFDIDINDAFKYQGVYFSTREGAVRAIDEVIKPFIKEHPEFVW